VRPNRPADAPRSFVAAVQDKYASEVTADHVPINPGREIVISGKVAQEVGFDKIRRKLAKLSELKIVILDAMRVGPEPCGKGDQSIADTCPRIMELDLSRNLFTELGTIVAISQDLHHLYSLRLKYLNLCLPACLPRIVTANSGKAAIGSRLSLKTRLFSRMAETLSSGLRTLVSMRHCCLPGRSGTLPEISRPSLRSTPASTSSLLFLPSLPNRCLSRIFRL